MVAFDIAVGGSQDVVNNVVQQLYPVLYKSGLLTQTINVGQVNIASASFDIQQAPTADFNSPTPDHLIKHYKDAMHIYPGLKELTDPKKAAVLKKVLAMLGDIAFTINVPLVSFTLNYDQPPSGPPKPPTTIPKASLSIGAVVTIETGTNPATIQIRGASAVASTGDPILDGIVNSAVVPFVLNLLNQKILGPIKIPTLSFQNVTVATPQLAIQNGFLLAFTALGNTSPDIPAPGATWPTDGVFVSLDANMITAAGSAAIAALGSPSGNFSEWEFTGNYGVNLGPLSGVSVNGDGSLSATIGAGASFDMTWHTPNWLPNIPFSASASGSVGITLSAGVTNGSLVVVIGGINNPNLSVDFDGIPDIIPGLSDLANYLIGTLITPLINQFLSGKSFNVYTIPTINIPLGPGININLPNVSTEELTEDGNPLLVAHGTPIIS